ncbi:MAG: ATP-binding cassette domain-containing protein [Lachnospiraceae bacterium]|nr:ATP-binding cassette domain-containing protein [Lachnospiraceae bacterium]
MNETGMIKIDNIIKVFEGKRGKVIANNGISLSVNHGEIVGLLGHNGAGKTTLVNQMLGLLKPTSGEITIMGQSIIRNPKQGRMLCSVQPQSQLSLGELSPLKAVTIMGQMRGGNETEMKAEAMRLFEALDITEWINKECNQLSGGVKRLTAFCMAVIHSKQVIILDEPTNDVDPVRRRYLWSEIKKLTQQGKGVILVTHNVAEAENVVDKVAILHHGKILRYGTAAQVSGKNGKDLRLTFLPSKGFTNDNLPEWATDVMPIEERIAFAVQKERLHLAVDWVRGQVECGAVYDYSLSESTLEDVYVKLTSEKENGNNDLNHAI